VTTVTRINKPRPSEKYIKCFYSLNKCSLLVCKPDILPSIFLLKSSSITAPRSRNNSGNGSFRKLTIITTTLWRNAYKEFKPVHVINNSRIFLQTWLKFIADYFRCLKISRQINLSSPSLIIFTSLRLKCCIFDRVKFIKWFWNKQNKS